MFQYIYKEEAWLFNIASGISSITILAASHIFLLTISNVLVQYPFELFGYHTTWGAFTYPAIFILTDLTTRLTSAQVARKIIYLSMAPGLLISYLIASYIEVADHLSWGVFTTIHRLPLRVALACLIAYTAGQLLDIFVFQHYRNNSTWWLAPSLATTLGNLIDTILFFGIAFYHSTNLFLSQHWPEIALVDMLFKVAISLLAFVPLYGFFLNLLTRNSFSKVMA